MSLSVNGGFEEQRIVTFTFDFHSVHKMLTQLSPRLQKLFEVSVIPFFVGHFSSITGL